MLTNNKRVHQIISRTEYLEGTWAAQDQEGLWASAQVIQTE